MNNHTSNTFDPVPLGERIERLEKKLDSLNMTLGRIEKLLAKTEPLLSLISKLPRIK